MLSKQFQKMKNPIFLSSSFKNNVSEWKKQQEIKKKIIDMNEAEGLRAQINQRTFGFSLFTGFVSFFFFFKVIFLDFFKLNKLKFAMIFLGIGSLIFFKIVWNLFEIVSDPISNERKIVFCNFKSGNAIFLNY